MCFNGFSNSIVPAFTGMSNVIFNTVVFLG